MAHEKKFKRYLFDIKSFFYVRVFGQLLYIKFLLLEFQNNRYVIVENSNIKPAVSILIPTFGFNTNLDRLLKSIFKYQNNISIEILICNDKPLARKKIKSWCEHNSQQFTKKNISVFSNRFNVGFSASVNYLSKIAKGEYLYLLNDDTEVISQEWISSLVESMKHSDVGITGSYLLFPNKYHIQHAGMYPFLKSDGKVYNYHYFKYFNKAYGQITKREVPMITGAALCVRKSLFFEIGGLKNRYLGAGGFDDSDFCNEVVKRGYKIIFCPKSKLIHHEGQTIRSSGKKHTITFLYNQAYYQKKWLDFLRTKYPRFTTI